MHMHRAELCAERLRLMFDARLLALKIALCSVGFSCCLSSMSVNTTSTQVIQAREGIEAIERVLVPSQTRANYEKY